MVIPKGWMAALAAVVLGFAASANAATYQFLSGRADISVTAGTTTLVENRTLFLDGIFATFDSVAPELSDFQFTTAPAQTIHLSSAFGGYDETPEDMATVLADFARAGLLNVGGGCCGSTPAHIAAIREAVAPYRPRTLPSLQASNESQAA